MVDAPEPPPELSAKVAFMLRGAFPTPPAAIETHLSWVFLTADRVYKLKKPVSTSFLDLRTLEARRLDCLAEVALNEALAPGVYRGAIPLTRDVEGRLALDGSGPVVEWLVVMDRLADASLLDRRLVDDPDSVAGGEIEALVDHLARFYRSTPAAPIDPERYRHRLRTALDLDRAVLLRPDHVLDRDDVSDLTDRLGAVIESQPDLADRGRRVVEGHGDLRPEHIVLSPEPLVIDRITFDRELRLIDPISDLALLAVECEFLGATGIGDEILARYLTSTDDPVSPETVALYRSLRATTRARLSVAHLEDGDRDALKWLDRTDAYLAIARRFLDLLVRGDELTPPESGRQSGVEV